MNTPTSEIEKLVMSLDTRERGELASKLLHSLGSPWADDDDGLEEAMRRDREMDLDPSRGITLEELDRRIAERFRR